MLQQAGHSRQLDWFLFERKWKCETKSQTERMSTFMQSGNAALKTYQSGNAARTNMSGNAACSIKTYQSGNAARTNMSGNAARANMATPLAQT
jgi:hypothetical protein